MMLHEVTQAAGAHKRRKRVGRGESSGHGKTCGRGDKGMQSRAGNGPHPLFIGGATPLYRRSPKRGFSNFEFRTEYTPVNLDTLGELFSDGERVDPDALRKVGLVGSASALVKVLGRGALSRKLSLEVHAISAAARAAVESAGGSVTLIARRDAAALAKAKRRTAKQRAKSERPSRLAKKKAARTN